MPTRLTRYIVGEIIKIFVVSLVALTMLILLIGVGRELLRQGLGAVAVLQLLPYVLPMSLQFAVPATALFSVCCVYGRMSADGEVSTVKATGISPLRLLQPAIVLALLLSPFAVFLSDLAVSWGRPGMNHVVLLSIEQIAYRLLRSQHSYSSPHGFTIHVQDVDGDRLVQPTVKVQQSGRNQAVELTAREGRLRLDHETHTLLLKVTDSRIEGGSGFQGDVPGEYEFGISLGSALREKETSKQRPSDLSLSAIRSETIQEERRSHQKVGQLAAYTGFSLLTARWDDIAAKKGIDYQQAIEGGRARLSKLQTEPWRRWAEGFSCFCFVLVGAPLAILLKTSDYWTTFGLCFLPTLLIYYPLFIFGLDQAKTGALPPYTPWIGNLVLVSIGIALMDRVRRY